MVINMYNEIKSLIPVMMYNAHEGNNITVKTCSYKIHIENIDYPVNEDSSSYPDAFYDYMSGQKKTLSFITFGDPYWYNDNTIVIEATSKFSKNNNLNLIESTELEQCRASIEKCFVEFGKYNIPLNMGMISILGDEKYRNKNHYVFILYPASARHSHLENMDAYYFYKDSKTKRATANKVTFNQNSHNDISMISTMREIRNEYSSFQQLPLTNITYNTRVEINYSDKYPTLSNIHQRGHGRDLVNDLQCYHEFHEKFYRRLHAELSQAGYKENLKPIMSGRNRKLSNAQSEQPSLKKRKLSSV